ncbi:tRNA dimethylallyltransferase [Hydrogenimonas sp.]|nr:tRNA dimethylallyltransferase [Hydrogenimonas sp.]
MKIVAILGPTASGKSDLSIRLASRHNAVILSLDSLSLYRKIDIASAKPSAEERGGVVHFGIDTISVDEHFSVSLFAELFKEAREYAEKREKDLIIVGGTGFYLKILMEGLSPLPPLTEEMRERLAYDMRDPERAYKTLLDIDRRYAESISSSDRYRIEKGLQVYFASGMRPTDYFLSNPPKPLLKNLHLYEIAVDREVLGERIAARTEKMFKAGLVDEVAELEYLYTRAPNPMKAIGIKEILDYFDAKVTLREAKERIVIHTRQLAKRQQTFNRTQFPPHPLLQADRLETEISSLLLQR